MGSDPFPLARGRPGGRSLARAGNIAGRSPGCVTDAGGSVAGRSTGSGPTQEGTLPVGPSSAFMADEGGPCLPGGGPLRQATHTQKDWAAAFNSCRIISSSVLLNPCCFCCSIIQPVIEHIQQGTFNAARTQMQYMERGCLRPLLLSDVGENSRPRPPECMTDAGGNSRRDGPQAEPRHY